MKELNIFPSHIALVDDELFDYLSKTKWYLSLGYAVSGKSSVGVKAGTRMHRLVFGLSNKLQVDHIDGNPTNNRIENLREASKKENRWNCKPNKDTISGVKGVYKDGSKWKALVNVDGVRYYLGMHESIQEAEAVVKVKYEELQKDFAFKGEVN